MTSRREVATSPVRRFEGDDLVDIAVYQRLMTGGYMSTFSLVEEGIEAGGVELDDVSKERWRRLICASYYIDEFIDESKDRRETHALYERGMDLALSFSGGMGVEQLLEGSSGVNPLLTPSILLLRNSVAGMSDFNLMALKRAALVVNDAAIEKAAATDIGQYLELLRQESDATAALLAHSVTPEVAVQPEFDAFVEAIHFVMRVAVYADSLIDLRGDYEQGVTGVSPTRRHMGAIALRAVQAARGASWPPGRLRISWRMASSVRPYVVFDEK